METKRVDRSAGFTLVEIMVVVVILGLLATVGAVGFMKYKRDADDGIAKTKCAEIEKAIEAFILTNDGISPDEILDRMLEEKAFKRPSDLIDPWKERYQVIQDDDGNYIVFSKGRDKQPDTDDDIYADGKVSERNEDF